MVPGEPPKERKDEKVDGKKKTQAEIEQEMAALQYTNPMLLEVRLALPKRVSTRLSLNSKHNLTLML